MRLGRETVAVVEDVVQLACADRRRLSVPAPTRAIARTMFQAVDGKIRELGGTPANDACAWVFPNGSVVEIVEGA